MTQEQTDRLALPLLQPGQAQKEMFHNEALTLLDMLVQGVVESVSADDPPAAPQAGQCWILGDAPGGAWAGMPGAIAGWTAAGWRFAGPRIGWRMWSAADRTAYRFGDGGWIADPIRPEAIVFAGEQVLGPRQPAIAAPADGATVDVQARAAIGAILSALRAHGLIGPE
ncbi:DUF2793 domain-containing protein [Stakelama saccharophila]|uniref:DUF2793 domain-containing protein n=1 Tax=Stakelama saccharophila TaxID=3075605 RepID=A0ABZ0B8I8_9SPHN|nr:DUF2793 domain-containing protein [Stakelama sp. W311]WNO53537.1 DUF2793 domain-containing protein [Stakelama sp. W311]